MNKIQPTLLVLVLVMSATLFVEAQGWPQFMQNIEHTSSTSEKSNKGSANFSERFTYETHAWVRSPPTVFDLDGDGFSEIVFGSDDGVLRVLDYKGNLKWYYETGGKIRSSPLIADLDGDGSNDIVFGSRDGLLYALNESGAVKWAVETGGPIDSSPNAGELALDFGLEVVVGSDDENIYVVSARGKVLWTYRTAEPVKSSPALADVDGDGNLEVIVGSNDNLVYVLRSPPAKVWMFQTQGDVSGSPAVFDVDGDGKKEVVVGSQDGNLYVLYLKLKEIVKGPRKCTPTGCSRSDIEVTQLAQKWNWTTKEVISSSPAIADINNDGLSEIVFGSEGKNLYILDGYGRRIKKYSVNKAVTDPASLADVNADGFKDIIFTSTDGIIYVLNHKGERIWSTQLESPIHAPPALADIDSDGILEIIVACDDGRLYVFGNEFSERIRRASEIYIMAVEAYDDGREDTALILLNQSKILYEEFDYGYGMVLVQDFVTRISADKLLDKALERYDEGNYESASTLMQEAIKLYTEIGYDEGISKADVFFSRIDADALLVEGMRYIQAGEFGRASDALKESKELYEYLGDSEGVAKAEKLLVEREVEFESTINSSIVSLMADTAYTRAWSSFYRRQLEDAISYSSTALKLYVSLEDEDNRVKTEILLTHARADLEYARGLEFVSSGDGVKAIGYFENALGLYEEINYSIGILKSESILDKTILVVEADVIYEDALKYYGLEKYDIAKALAEDALKGFRILNDTGGIERATFLLTEASRENRKQKEKRNLIVLSLLGVVILGFVVWSKNKSRSRKKPEESQTLRKESSQLNIQNNLAKQKFKFPRPKFKPPKIKVPRVSIPKPEIIFPTISKPNIPSAKNTIKKMVPEKVERPAGTGIRSRIKKGRILEGKTTKLEKVERPVRRDLIIERLVPKVEKPKKKEKLGIVIPKSKRPTVDTNIEVKPKIEIVKEKLVAKKSIPAEKVQPKPRVESPVSPPKVESPKPPPKVSEPKKEVKQKTISDESPVDRVKRIRHIQEKTRIGWPSIASEPNDLFLLVLRMHELGLGEKILVGDARDVLRAEQKKFVRWVKQLHKRNWLTLEHHENTFTLRLSDEMIAKEKNRKITDEDDFF
ncbi:MAG: PQQ-binding-like beta-propeller repeat protein [Methanobacteriota archaeon]